MQGCSDDFILDSNVPDCERNNGERDKGYRRWSVDNEIHENCFYDNEPQAWADVIGGNNDWDGNYG